jgi:23S rRNA pseudouridine1911/1915/1917 synthase
MIRVEVAAPLGGARLDRVVAGLDGVGSRTLAARLVEEGRVLVDGAPRHRAFRLLPGMTVEVDVPDPDDALPEHDPSVPFAIRYEDEHLLIVDKPAGVVTHPSPGSRDATLVHGLLGRAVVGGDDPLRPGIVHRLDRDTSGLLVAARSQEAHRGLGRLMRRRAIEREYLALVHGRPSARSGRIEAPIGRDPAHRTRMAVDGNAARPAVTHFVLEEALASFTLLRLRLETGRTHQIRVHLGAIGHPVVGDRTYTPSSAERLGLGRQFLHAARLGFPHPITGEALEVESPLPDDLAAALERARHPVGR